MIITICKDRECWKPLIAYDISDKYEISNYGNVRTIQNKTPIKSTICADGYKRVSLRNDNDIRNVYLVHRLVAFVFVDGYDASVGKVIVNHRDSDRANSYYENLELLSESYTIEDIIKILEIPPMQVNKYRKNICDIKYHRTFLPISAKYIFPENIYYRKSLYPDDIIILICEHLEGGTPMPQITDIVVNKLKYNRTSVRDFIYDIRRRRIHTDISYMYKW